jgi:5,10-methylene-tetrahydrofolate dehydrogenase/methenyl tetrahydrofolate cyclohydrolase
VLIVGSRKDSQTYVNMKKKKCEELGILSFGRCDHLSVIHVRPAALRRAVI